MIYELDPIRDSRWEQFLERTSNASVFHSPKWLLALQRTYGYKATVFTTSRPGQELVNGAVFCRVHSRLTGRRLVSLPFSDHCEPLFASVDGFNELQHHLLQRCQIEKLRYVELRSAFEVEQKAQLLLESGTFYFHKLDLRPREDQLLQSFHKTAIRQPIARAEREELRYEKGGTNTLLQRFYSLFVETRLRQKIPPTPLKWFANVLECLGGDATIRIASKGDQPIAATFCLTHKQTMVYKYGCSDKTASNLGAVPLLIWKGIQESKSAGIEEMDMGRSDPDNEGLITFKNRWGAAQSKLTYLRFPQNNPGALKDSSLSKFAKEAFTRLPEGMRIGIGALLYRHIG
jgi:lipid II:glycine glycyltransferase (peptidoglycan interpeptide bridge formation enzyme)